MLWLVVPAASWITQMQSKYGVQTSNVANVWDGNASSDFNAFNTMGYYWHWPQDADSNRGLGCARVVPRPALHRQVYNHSPPESLHSPQLCPHLHLPHNSGGIQWAWDDSLCKETNGGYKFFSDNFEDQFKEVRCVPPVGLADCPHHKQKQTPTLIAHRL